MTTLISCYIGERVKAQPVYQYALQRLKMVWTTYGLKGEEWEKLHGQPQTCSRQSYAI